MTSPRRRWSGHGRLVAPTHLPGPRERHGCCMTRAYTCTTTRAIRLVMGTPLIVSARLVRRQYVSVNVRTTLPTGPPARTQTTTCAGSKMDSRKLKISDPRDDDRVIGTVIVIQKPPSRSWRVSSRSLPTIGCCGHRLLSTGPILYGTIMGRFATCHAHTDILRLRGLDGVRDRQVKLPCG